MSLEKEIRKIVESHGAKLYGTQTLSENDQTIFRVNITKPEGVNLDLCADISRDLSPMLDVYPPMSGHYFLEVSSPGIERTLSSTEQFKASIGESVRLKLSNGDTIKGKLVGFENGEAVLETSVGEERFALEEIRQARTYFEW